MTSETDICCSINISYPVFRFDLLSLGIKNKGIIVYMVVVERVYRINGIEYKSLDEIPPELKKFVNIDLTEKLKNHPEGYQETIISPVSENSLELKSMTWILYIASQAMSLAENQALRTVAILLRLVDVNSYISLIFSFFIGQVSYSFAKRRYSKKIIGLNIKYSENLSFLEKFAIAQVSASYSLVLNLLFFLILFLTRS